MGAGAMPPLWDRLPGVGVPVALVVGEHDAKFRDIEPQWRERGISGVALHPGYVRTDMTGMLASISPKKSVRGIRQVLADLGVATSGQFLDYKGETVAW